MATESAEIEDLGDRYGATLGDHPREIAAVRSAVHRLAAGNGFGDRADDLVLALDEAIANAQEHGRPPIRVAAWADGRMVVEVSDVGGGFDQHSVWSTHPPARHGRRGRGLWIMRQLTDAVAITVKDGCTSVRLELSRDPQIGA